MNAMTVVGAVVACACGVLAESTDFETRADATVRAWHESGAFDGSVLMIQDGKVAYKGGFGMANRTWDIRNTPETKFHIASVTKQFVAVLTLQLVDEGLVDLDAKVTAYLPWYRADTGDRITVRQLLQHMSGLPEPITEADQIDDALLVTDNPRALIEQFASGDLLFDPGTEFNYSNADYYLLGAIIEAQRGAPFADVLRKRILDPLEMNDTGMRRFENVVEGMATGYMKVDGGYQHHVHFGQLAYAAAGMYSTVEDLGRWNIAMLNHTVLSKEMTELMYTPVVLEGDRGSYVGLGSWIYKRPLPPENAIAPRIVERRGHISPFIALNVICPDDGHAYTVLTNHDPCDLETLPYASGMPLDLLLLLFDREPDGPPRAETGE